MDTPSFIENHISQIPALQFLMKLGYKYLTPDEALEARGNRSSNVLLERILKEQLQTINKIEYKGKDFPFQETTINTAILALRDLPVQDGFLAASQAFYDLVTLGRSFEQNVLGDKKSFSFKYIDWENPDNNTYHVTEEFSVLRSERTDTYRPDIVIFVNGIPIVIIECKSPKLKEPIDLAIEQHLRNQQENSIRSLYHYSNLLLALSVSEAKYATTATKKEFWSVWKEQFQNKEKEQEQLQALREIKNAPLPQNDRTLLFRERFKYVISYFKELEQEELAITEQDKLLYNLCRKDRLLDIMFNYTLFDEGEKKIARYQQYFAVKQTLKKVAVIQEDGKRKGGVIWHTQGSGKSLTMVMLAQLIATHPNIKNPKIVLVTDRIDLDDQITGTFRKCNKAVENAASGKDLVTLMESKSDAIITTIINKFEAAVRYAAEPFTSSNIFILIDEGHRSQYGTFNVKMQRIFPNACFIAFTGTPLMKREKSTAAKFGGLIDIYSITTAVEDKAVVPLLYEGRHNIMEVNEKPLDTFFDRVAEPLTDYGKTSLKRKFSTRNTVVQSLNFIESTAWDISKHFVDNIQNTGFKGQLVAPNKFTALRYREILKEIRKVSVELLISAPDMREGEDDAFEIKDDKVKAFYKAMMDKYGTREKYEKAIITSFKKQDHPEIIIVVDKLLTGFDAPINQVLYLTRQLKEHSLLQAIARVNRLHPGKDYGYIIDYYGNLENLDSALTTYSGLEEFDEEELAGTLTNINVELQKLPQAHSELWDIFKEIRNKYDEPAYEELLSDEAKRYAFYEKLSIYARLLKLALSSLDFSIKTPEKQVEKYKSDAHFFLALRVAVKRRYADEVDFRAYEPQIQKLIDKHITSDGEVLKITPLVNIFDKEQRQAEVEKITGKAAKADHIASRTIKAINIRMNEDPVFYKRLSQLIKDAIDDYHRQRISEAEYLAKAKDFEDTFINGKRDNVPDRIKDNSIAIAFYNLAYEDWKEGLSSKPNKIEIAAEIAEGIDRIMTANIFENGKKVIDWQNNLDIDGKIKIQLDDFLYDTKAKYDLDISFDQFDQLIAEFIKVAKVKHN